MKRLVLFVLCPVLACAAPKKKLESKIESPVASPAESSAKPAIEPPVSVGKVVKGRGGVYMPDPNTRSVIEFSGDQIDVVLRTLARKANVDLVLSPTIVKDVPTGVNLRLESKTPYEAIEVICQSNGLIMAKKGGVHYVSSEADKDAAAAKDYAQREKIRFDALIAEGFKREEALEILLRKGEAMKPGKTRSPSE